MNNITADSLLVALSVVRMHPEWPPPLHFTVQTSNINASRSSLGIDSVNIQGGLFKSHKIKIYQLGINYFVRNDNLNIQLI